METTPWESRVTEYVAAVSLFRRRLRAVLAFQDLSWTEAAVVAHLDTQGPSTAADLARAQVMKPQSMGTVVDGLEAQGLIARSPHPSDGRRILIALTPSGSALRRDVSAAKQTWLVEAFARLAPDERSLLFETTGILRRLAES